MANIHTVHEVVDEEDYQQRLVDAGNNLVMVDFYAQWCGPCRTIDPLLKDVVAKYNGKLVILKVDVDKQTELVMNAEINCMPTFYFYKNGQKIQEFSGAKKEKLFELVEELISGNESA